MQKLIPTRLTIFALILVLALPSLASAQRNKNKKKTFEDTTDVVVIEVPVTVTTRDGQPVTGLTKENFEITDEGKKQTIIGFEEINLLETAEEEAAAEVDAPPPLAVPIAARRHFLLFFDMANSSPESLIPAREAAADVLAELHPSDLAAVALYTTNGGTQMILGFTSDRRQVELAIATLGAPNLIDRGSDPLNLYLGNLVDAGPTAEAEGAGGRGGDAISEVAADQIDGLVRSITAAETQAAENRLTAMKRNIEAAAEMLGRIDGRKHVVFFSEGVPDELLVGDATAFGTGSTESANGGAGSQLTDTSSFSNVAGNTRAQNDLASIISAFSRAGCVVHAVDIGRLRADADQQGRASGASSLTALAKDTGGELFLNFNELGDAMDQMLVSTSVTYLLAFQPAKLKTDGEYHRLKVKLKNAPRGARASARDGYYAPKPGDQVTAQEKQVSTAQKILDGEEGGDFGLDVLSAVMPIPNAKAYVPLLIEIDGDTFLAGASEGTAQAELYIYALGEDGGVYDFATQELGLDLAQAGDALRRTGLKYWAHVDLPAGEYTARVLVRNKVSGASALRRIPISVPEGDAGVLWPAMASEPFDRWVTVREGEDRQRNVPFPFMTAAGPFIPSARPVVPKKGSTELFLKGVSLAGWSVGANIVDASGATADKASFSVKEEMGPVEGVQTAKAELKTKGLAAGEYALTLSATDASGTVRTSTMPFVVE